MTKKAKFVLFAGLLISLVFVLFACAGRQLEVEPISKSEHPLELINNLEKDLALARKDQVNVLAPTWFAKAESSLADAKHRFDQGAELAKIFDGIAKGRAQLRRAKEIAEVSKATLAEAIKGRNLAREAGAAELGKDYAKAEEEFLELTRAIEKNNISYPQRNKEKVTEQFRQLEIRAIKIRTIGEVRKLLRVAEKQKTDKIAPASFTAAKNKLAEADSFIAENPYKKQKMNELANEALFLSRRHLEIADESRKLQTMQPEQIAIWVEEILHKAARQISAPDMRDHSFDKQVENILESISVQQADHEFINKKVKQQQTEINNLQRQIAVLEGQSRKQQQRLMAERQLTQLFNEVHSYFNPKEAEVYKRENQLIIRLKTMHFPVGQAVISPKNYTLLSKVQRAIRAFGEPDVIIGGHTDSTGPEPVNEHLSQQRAEAVRQYLVVNRTLPYDKIIAVGYGSMRPLASNATEKGRAINRRIDITISPTVKTDHSLK
jgi:OOP family OmpA-OmpF porin